MEVEALASLTQFGVAGLIGWMWIVERRAASERERQLREAHDRLTADRTRLEVLVQALRDNTRALTALEAGQRGVVELLRRLGAEPRAGGDAP
jgi:hypothetical protein